MKSKSEESETPLFDPPSHNYRWVLLSGVWLVYFSFGIAIASMPPLIEPITRDLAISHGAMGTILGAWPLIYIISSVPAGTLIDRLGPQRSIILCVLLIATSCVLRGFATDYFSLFLSVAVFGLGGPLISIGAPKVMSLWFEGKERGLATGIYLSGPHIGYIAALSLTNSVMMPYFEGEWRFVLFSFGALALLCGILWAIISYHPVSRVMERQMAREFRLPQIQILKDLLSDPVIRLILLISATMFTFSHGLNAWLPEILRIGGMDLITAGYWASIPTAVGIIAALFIARLATKEKSLSVLSCLFILAGISTLLLHLPTSPLLALGLICQGIARGAMMAVIILILLENRGVGSRNAGAAGGLFFSVAEIGGVMGPVLVGSLYDFTGEFSLSLYMMTAICALLLLMLTRLRSLIHNNP